MHTCRECKTVINTTRFPLLKREGLNITATAGKEMCLRCVAIVMNWVAGEPLIATRAIDGWIDRELVPEGK